MMEKYGADMNNLPPTDEQYRRISRLRINAGVDGIELPTTRKEAEELIKKLEKINDVEREKRI